jgi:CYTH domain-containing protein/predicted ATPase
VGSSAAKKIYKVVCTGGPGGGKSTGIPYIEQKMIEYGCVVLTSPEVARDLIRRGMDILAAVEAADWETVFRYEVLMARKQIFEEELMMDIARVMPSGDKPIIILHDRGLRDFIPYLGPGQEERFYRELGIGREDTYNYDRVIHLVTAADGAEQYYQTDKERRETPEQARERDVATLQAWNGPVHVDVIDNSTNFEEKLKRALRSACHVAGIPEPIEKERWFNVSACPPLEKFPVPYTELLLEQRYLVSENPGVSRRIRSQTFGRVTRYYLTEKEDVPGKIDERLERTEAISADMYEALTKSADPERGVIRKRRICFIWDRNYFELDMFLDPHQGKMKLELELTSDSDRFTTPNWIATTEVTGDKRFSNRQLAKKAAAWPSV